MKRICLLLLCSSLFKWCAAQAHLDHDVVTMENAFASYALEAGAKAAFLKYMDSNSVIFNKGKVLNGVRYWQQAGDLPGKLLWRPVFSCIAGDGRSGFTTGPFEFRKTLHDSAQHCGQYTTIWQKNEQGAWHLWADLGISYPGSLFNAPQPEVFTGHQPSHSIVDSSVSAVENAFIEAFRRTPPEAFSSVLLPETWLNINGQHPLRGSAGVHKLLRHIPADITFIPLASVTTTSRDLTYVYGYVRHAGRQENYLRVWAHTSTGWKLLLQVLRW